jgi:Ca2+-binding RTX toxin-like protein
MVDGSGRDLPEISGSAASDNLGDTGFEVVTATSAADIVLSDGDWVLRASFDRHGHDLLIEGRDGEHLLIRDYFAQSSEPDLDLGEGTLSGHVVARLAGPMAEGFAQAGAADASPVGTISDVSGQAWATHVDGSRVPLANGDDIYMGDVVETAAGSALNIAFLDGTSLSLSDDARMVIDDMVYTPGSAENSASISMVQGLFVLVSGDIAKTGEMTIETPVSTIGIRGTSVAIQAATEGLRNLITLLADPDGNVGVVEVATQVARVILDTLGASTSVTSAGLAPSAVEILTGDQIEAAYRAALSTMQLRTGTSLGVSNDQDGATPDQGPDDNAPSGNDDDASAEDQESFLQAVNELIATLQNVGVDGEELTGEEEDALVEAAAAVQIDVTPPLKVLLSTPDKLRVDTSPDAGVVAQEKTTSGNEGNLNFHNNSTDSFGNNGSAQFGVADSGALGSQSVAPVGFLNAGQTAGFFFDPNNAGNFTDPITGGSAASGYTVTFDTASLAEAAGISGSATGRNANGSNGLNASTLAEISDGAVVATTSGGNSAIDYTQIATLGSGTSFLIVEILLQNISGQALDLGFLESINPNQDATGASPTSATFNQVIDNPSLSGEAIVMATGPNSGVDFVLYANQTEIENANLSLNDADVAVRASVSSGSTFETNPGAVFNSPNAGGSTADVAINLAYEITALGAGETAYLSFVVSLNIASTLSDLLFARPGALTIDGLAGNDTLIGSTANDMLIGNVGDDLLNGNEGDDSLLGGAGTDTLLGGAGADHLTGGLGGDAILGGAGDDRILWTTGDGSDQVDGGDGNDRLFVEGQTNAPSNVSITQNAGHDVIVGVNGGVAVVGQNLEQIQIVTGSAADNVLLSDLTGTDLAGADGLAPVAAELGDGDDTANAAIAGVSVQFSGGDGDDRLIGGVGADTLEGGAGADSLFGNLGADTIFGDGGNDSLQGSAGDDLLDGGSGNDTLDGGVGNDRLLGQGGNDVLDGGQGSDTLDGGDGDDTVFWQAGQSLSDSDGDDLVLGGSGYDELLLSGTTEGDAFRVNFGGLGVALAPGSLSIEHQPSGSLITAYAVERISVEAGEGDDSFTIGAGGGNLAGAGVHELIFDGGDGDDVFDGRYQGSSTVALTVYGGAGDDTLIGGDGNDLLAGGDGNDLIVASPGYDAIFGGDGNDTVIWSGGNSVVESDGDVFVDGGGGYDVLAISAGLSTAGDSVILAVGGIESSLSSELIIDTNNGDHVLIATDVERIDGQFGDLDDSLLIEGDLREAGVRVLMVEGNGGNDILNAAGRGYGGFSVAFYGGQGDDILTGSGGNDLLDGGDDGDTLVTGLGQGDDRLEGGAGNDLAVVEGAEDDDRVIIGSDGQGNAIIEDDASGDTVTIDGVEALKFEGFGGDDTVSVGALSGTDVTNASVSIFGGAGNDTVLGENADRRLVVDGGSGNDILHGGSGNDVLLGGSGNDQLSGGAGENTISGQDGNDRITSALGQGNDLIDGGAGNDTLLFNGFGTDDAILEVFGRDGNVILTSGGQTVSASGVEDFTVVAGDGNDEIAIGALDGSGIQAFTIAAGAGNDVVNGGFADTALLVTGGAGSDSITGGSGNDGLFGGIGNDVLDGGAGNDRLDGGDGDDLLLWYATGEAVGGSFGGGTGSVSSYSEINSGDDVFLGGDGDDTLELFGSGFAASEISFHLYSDLVFEVAGDGNLHIGVAADGGSFAEVGMVASSVESVIFQAGTSNTEVVIEDGLEGSGVAFVGFYGGDGDDIFDGGDRAAGSFRVAAHGGNGSDELIGSAGDDVLDGGAGNDLLISTLGHGNDVLLGGDGNDHAHIAATDGADLIEIFGDAGNDVIVSSADGAIILDGVEELALRMGGGGDSVTIGSLDGTDIAQSSVTVFGGDGDDVIDGYDADRRVVAYGDGGNDTLVGGDRNDVLSGGDGNDVLLGSGGNDVIAGDSGNDQIIWHHSGLYFGSDGDDVVDGGDGQDLLVIVGDVGDDAATISGGGGLFAEVTPAGVLVDAASDGAFIDAVNIEGLFFDGGDGNDVVVLEGDLAGAGIVSVGFLGGAGDDVLRDNGYGAGFDVTAFGGDGNDTLEGSGGNDSLDGGTGNDTLDGGAGNDTLDGGSGNDTFSWAGGDGNDAIDGGTGDDLLIITGTEGNDAISLFDNGSGGLVVVVNSETLSVTSVEDLIIDAGDGDDTITIGDLGATAIGNDSISVLGGAGNDVVDGASAGRRIVADGGLGNDTLTGSTLADSLSGGEGDDVFFWAPGDGNDSIDGASGNDTLVVSGVTGNDTVEFTEDGFGNAVLSVNGESLTTSSVEDFQGIDLPAPGDDTVIGTSGNDTIVWTSGDGNDLIDGAGGDDVLVITGTEGNDTIDVFDDGFGNVIAVVNSETLTVSSVEELVVVSLDGDDVVTIGDLTGTAISNDTISYTGGAGNDILDASLAGKRIVADGGSGNDTLTGGDLGDTLTGGIGNDSLVGGNGDDLIVWERRAGGTLFDSDGSDTVDGGSGNDTLKLVGSADGEAFLLNGSGGGNLQIDGERIDFSGIETLSLSGGAGNDSLQAGSALDGQGLGLVVFDGGDGNDVVDLGGAGNDVALEALGGAGNDTLAGGARNDTLAGGIGNDVFLWDDDEGDDTVTGGEGTDTLVVSSVGSGLAVLMAGGTPLLTVASGELVDVVSFDTLEILDLVGSLGNDLVQIDSNAGLQRVTASLDDGDDVFEVTSGVALESSVDALLGGALADTFDGGAGNDLLQGRDGDDVLEGGDGVDMLIGGAGSDDVSGGSGADTIVWTVGEGSDRIDGGAGNDSASLFGSAGNDHVFNIVDSGSGNAQVQIGGESLTVTSVENLVVFAGEGNDIVTVGDLSATGVQRFTFFGVGGNDILDASASDVHVIAIGSNGSGGAAGDDHLQGGALNDILQGDGGNDTLIGHGGNDFISGGTGDDLIVWEDQSSGSFSDSDGNDVVSGNDGNDVLEMHASSSGSVFIVDGFGSPHVHVGNDRIDFDTVETLSFVGGAGNDAVLSDTPLDGIGVTRLVFDGAGGNDVADLSTLGNDVVVEASGGAGNDTLTGSANDDTLSGGDGDDLLNGGAGIDTIDGGDGDDHVVWVADDGNDDIESGAGNDILEMFLSDGDDTGVINEAFPGALRVFAGSEQVVVDNVEAIILRGQDGNDSFSIAGHAREELPLVSFDGGAGNDSVSGGNMLGDLHADGGIGNDVLTGGRGNDSLVGGDGDDTLNGGQGNDIAVGGAGNDFFRWSGGDGDDTLDGGAGNDKILITTDAGIVSHSLSASGNDLIVSADGGGTSTLSSIEVVSIFGGAGDDTLTVQDLSGTAVTEVAFFSSDGNDVVTVNGSIGARVVAGNGNDQLFGGSGNDDFAGQSGNDFLEGGAGNDTLNGGSGDDLIVWTNRSVGSFSDSDGSDTVDGSSGNDILEVHASDLGDSYVVDGTGFTHVEIGSDNIVFFGIETLSFVGGAGNDSVVSNGFVTFAPLDVVVEGAAGDDTVDFSSVSSSAVVVNADGGAGNDTLTGGAGNDTLAGGDGNDILDGGLGNDDLQGGAGDDTISWAGGDGSDLIDGGEGRDVLSILGTGGNDSIGIAGDGLGNAVLTLGSESLTVSAVEDFSITETGFGDDVITISDLSATALAGGTVTVDLGAGNDVLNGANATTAISAFASSGNDTLTGGSGDDTLNGSSGDDLIEGGAGNDTLDASLGNDVLRGGDGDDLLNGSSGNDTLEGGAGNDTLSGSDSNDILTGGQGADVVNGGDGDDTVSWSVGDGEDTIDGGADTDVLVVNGSAGNDIIDIFDDGFGNVVVVVNDETFTASNVEELIINTGDGDDVVTVGDLSGTSVSNDTISFSGGAGNDVLDAADSGKRIVALGGDGDDTLSGSSLLDSLNGGAGNDILTGGLGNDTLEGGSGNDTYVQDADQGSDLIIDSDGEDQFGFTLALGVDLDDQLAHFSIVGTTLEIQTIYGETITVSDHFGTGTLESYEAASSSLWEGQQTFTVELLTDANSTSAYGPGVRIGDVLFGTGAADTIFGGAGPDIVQAGDGNDHVVGGSFNLFYDDDLGDDRIYGSLSGGSDAISFMGEAANGVTIDEAAGTAVHGSQTDVFSSIDEFYGSAQDDNFVGAVSGTFQQFTSWEGFAGNDTFTGGANTDVVSYFYSTGAVVVDLQGGTASDGMGGTDTFVSSIEGVFGSRFDDTITGDGGDNRLDGFRGDDLLIGGGGNDLYRHDLRDGDDTIVDSSGAEDALRIDFDQVAINTERSADGNDLVITTTVGDTVTVVDQFNGQTLEFLQDTSTRGGRFPVAIAQDPVNETAGQTDLLIGFASNDTITTTGGFDYVFGGGGDDTLISVTAEGSRMTGGAGNDTVIGSGSGNDEISFLDHTVGAVISFDGNGNGTAVFAGGETDTFQSIVAVYGSQGNDTITSTGSGFSWLEGSGGDDTLIGSGSGDTIGFFTASVAVSFVLSATGDGVFDGGDELGTDTYFGIDRVGGTRFNDRLEGNDSDNRLTGFQGDDVLVGNAGADRLDGRDGQDLLEGGDGDDELLGGNGNDALQGGAGNDYLEGDQESRPQATGNDTLEGGAGNDTLIGGNGDDLLVGGDDDDIIDGGVGFDTVDYSDAGGAVSVNLASGNASGQGADLLSSVERVVGSAFGDTLTGANAPDGEYQEFQGGAGNDLIIGSSDDLMEDLVDYSDATGGVTVDLVAGTASGAGVGNDTLVDIDGVRGSAFADTITGGNNDEFEQFIGGAGNDIIDGGSGFDDAFYREDPFAISVVLTSDNAFTVTDGYGDTDTLTDFERLTGSRYDDLFDLSASFNGVIQVRGRDGADTIDGSGGEVLVVYNRAPSGVTVNLTGGFAIDGYGTVDTLIDVEHARGSAHDDTLIGSGVANFLRGDAGNDTLSGGGGDDTLVAGSGNDILNGGDGNDLFEGSQGNDQIAAGGGNDTIFWQSGDGNDAIDGGAGIDVLSLTGSDGNDIIDISQDVSGNVIVVVNGETLTVSTLEDIVITTGAGDDVVTVGDLMGTAVSNDTIRLLASSGRTDFDASGSGKRLVAEGGDADNTFSGGSLNDTLTGGAGNDVLNGNGGDDLLTGGIDTDTLSGGAGDDRIVWESRNVGTFSDTDGSDSVSGGDGSDTLAFFGSANGDTFIVNGSGSAHVLVDGDRIDFDTLETLSFGGGDGNDSLLVGTALAGSGVSGIVFDGGAGDDTVDFSTAGNDAVVQADGGAGDDVLTGAGIGDVLSGGDGNDRIEGGAGNDSLTGGAGNDLFVWVDDEGDDTIDGGDDDDALIVSASGLPGEALAVTIDGATGEFLVGSGARNDSIAVTGIEELSIDGSTGNDTVDVQASAGLSFILGSLQGGNDTFDINGALSLSASIDGGAGDDLLSGASGNDSLLGGDGNDVLDGGAGVDHLQGGSGNDTVSWAGGDGNDIIDGGSGIDVLSVTGTLGDDSYDLSDDGFGNAVLTLGSDTLTATSIESLVITQTGFGNDAVTIGDLSGTALAGGVVLLNLGAGNDTLDASAATTSIDVNGSNGDDTLTGGSANDTLNGSNGNDVLSGGDGDDTLDGSGNDDELNGGAGNDSL